MHSGRQFGGLPRKVSIQAHDGEFPTSLHIEFGPQGEGSHGLTNGGGIISEITYTLVFELVSPTKICLLAYTFH